MNYKLYEIGQEQFENRLDEYTFRNDCYERAKELIEELARKAYQSRQNVQSRAEAYFLICSSSEFGIECGNRWLMRLAV